MESNESDSLRMLTDISCRIERELETFQDEFQTAPLSTISSPFREAITSSFMRGGKRLRPTLFVLSYRGYASEPAPNLYKSAVALELLHDFMLIHDDIVDRSPIRRTGPALHAHFDDVLAHHPTARFSGQDMAMIVGDLMYAIGLKRFLSVEESPERKLRAMECLTTAAVFTACGELKELLDTLQARDCVTAEGIAQTCLWKTAYYSFVCPFVAGATLAGADEAELGTLMRCALLLGMAFQIRDDILDLTGDSHATGEEPEGNDIQEGKITLPVWYALQHVGARDASYLAAVYDGGCQTPSALSEAQRIVRYSGGVEYAQAEIARQMDEAHLLLESLTMAETYRGLLSRYVGQLMALSGSTSSFSQTLGVGAA